MKVQQLKKPIAEPSKVFQITMRLPDYYYEGLKRIAIKYGGIQGTITYALRRFVNSHKPKGKPSRIKRYTFKIDQELKDQMKNLSLEYTINQQQGIEAAIIDLLREEGIV